MNEFSKSIPIISVVVCTFNRSELLKGVIESLLNQSLDKTLYEMIVVDNASTDNTNKVVQEFIGNFKDYNIKYVYEPKLGLSNARNAGYKNSLSEYVAYIDDDAKAEKNWLKEICYVIYIIKADILGGPIYPFYQIEKPKWFLDKYEIRTNGDEARLLKENEYMSGSNIVFKKEIIEFFGGFDIRIGMKGNKLYYGEETKLIVESRRRIANIKVFYDPKIIVHHLVPKNKMKIAYFIKSNFTHGKCELDVWGGKITLRSKIKYLIAFLREIKIISILGIKGIFFRNKKKFNYYQNYLIEVITPHVYYLGLLYCRIMSE